IDGFMIRIQFCQFVPRMSQIASLLGAEQRKVNNQLFLGHYTSLDGLHRGIPALRACEEICCARDLAFRR
ncbi:MAG: hypothetical protein ACREYE_05620, partial [Gammaproteobacteria bacterium]